MQKMLYEVSLKRQKNQNTIFLATGFVPCEFNEIHFCKGIGLKEFAQNPSLKTLPEISIQEKVEPSKFNARRAVYCRFRIRLNTHRLAMGDNPFLASSDAQEVML